MNEHETSTAVRVGTPIRLDGRAGAYPARDFGREIEEIGYEATKFAFDGLREDEEIRHVFDPDDPDKIAGRIKMIESLGRSGICLAVPEYKEDPAVPARLLGFGLLRSNVSHNRLVNIIADRILRRPAIPDLAMIHVRPDSRMRGVGSSLLQLLAHRAYEERLVTKPAIQIIDGYDSMKDFFEYYQFKVSPDKPVEIIPDYFGPGKPATAHTYEAENWGMVFSRVHGYGRLREQVGE